MCQPCKQACKKKQSQAYVNSFLHIPTYIQKHCKDVIWREVI